MRSGQFSAKYFLFFNIVKGQGKYFLIIRDFHSRENNIYTEEILNEILWIIKLLFFKKFVIKTKLSFERGDCHYLSRFDENFYNLSKFFRIILRV